MPSLEIKGRFRALLASYRGEDSSLKARMLLLISGTAVAQTVALAVSPILARLFGPAAFGTFGVYLAALGVLGAASSWKFGMAVPLPESDEDAVGVLVAGLLGTLVSVLVVVCIILFAGHWIARVLLREPGVAPFLWFVPVGVLGVGLTDMLTGWCLRHREFGVLVRIRVERAAGTGVWQAIAGTLFRLTPAGLISGDAAGRFIGVFGIARTVLRIERTRGTRITKKLLKRVMSRYRAFALIATPSTLLSAAGVWAPVLLLTLWWGPVAAGLYTIGQRVVGAPLGLLGTSAGQVYVSELALRSRTDRGAMRPLFRKTTRALFWLGVPAAILTVFLAPLVFRVVFGAQWEDAGTMLQWQAFALVGQLVAVPLAQTLNLLDRQHVQFGWDAGRLVAVVAGFGGAHLLHLSAINSISIYGAVTALMYADLVFLGWRAVVQESAQVLEPKAGG